MAKVTFENVSKHFGNFTAVKDLNLTVEDEEFLCLVGPSGCGKTTTLRMLAGLNDISEGKIKIGNKTVNDVPSKDRDIAMVFQSYALYPHYTVYDNMAFGLRTRYHSPKASAFLSFFIGGFYALFLGLLYLILWLFGFLGLNENLFFVASLFGLGLILLLFPEVRRDIKIYIMTLFSKYFSIIRTHLENEKEIEEKVLETAQLLNIEEQLWKKPKQLSGGQRQRVALGRAIIRKPKVFLMDEPLSNLDAKLRVQMRAELERLTHKLKVTSIYVTHDQIEAMTLGHRIAIINEGILNQVGTPDEVYNRPHNQFVAGFIGSPSMNFFQGYIKEKDGFLTFNSTGFDYSIPAQYNNLKSYINKEIIMGIRPEHIRINNHHNTNNLIKAIIGVLEPIGAGTYVYLDLPNNEEIVVHAEGIINLHVDSEITVSFLDDKLHFFEKDTELRIDS